MRTGGGPHLLALSDEDNEEDIAEGRRAHPSDLWLAPIHHLVEHDLVWGKYIDPNTRGKPIP